MSHLTMKYRSATATIDMIMTLMYSPYFMIVSLSWSSGTNEWRYQPSAARIQFQQPAPIVV